MFRVEMSTHVIGRKAHFFGCYLKLGAVTLDGTSQTALYFFITVPSKLCQALPYTNH